MRTRHRFINRHWLWVLLPAVVLTLSAGFPLAQTRSRSGSKAKLIGNYDIRFNGGWDGLQLLQRRLAARPGDSRSKVQQTMTSMVQEAEAFKAENPNTDVVVSPVIGLPEVVSNNAGLTKSSAGRDGMQVVRDFLRTNAAIYGIDRSEVDALHFIGESFSPSGLRMVRFEQVVNGIPVFQSETRAILDADGRLVRTLGVLIPNSSDAEPLTDLISPAEALSAAMASVDLQLDVSAMEVQKGDKENKKTSVKVNNRLIAGEADSKLVYFPLAPGVLIPAWSQVAFTRTDRDWYTLVDAKTGALLWRKNIRSDVSTHDARFRVYVQADGKTPADSPAPHSPTTNTIGLGTQYAEIAPTIVSMLTAQDIVASPNGWINDCPGGGCTAAETQTIGNNVHAYMDRTVGGANTNVPDTDAGSVLDGNGKPTGNPDANGRNRDFLGTSPRDFQTNYLPPPQGGNPEAGQTATGAGSSGTNALDQFRRGAVTHLFYVSNWYHDQLFALGFNEAAGNFQLTNFSGMGLGNDRVLAECQDGSSTNNANFSTPPDGGSGRAQMFRFTGPTIDRDGDLDAEVLIHELTHGTSNRLIGNAAGLNWDVGGGMGEGWSDFYALSLLNNTNADDPNGLYASGAYATFKLIGLLDNYVYGIRRFPYSTDNTINPLTWADADDITNNIAGGVAPSPINFNSAGALEVHNVGEIWCLTLWEVRARVIGDPAGANGDVPTGNHTMLQLVTDAMKMTPASPSFIDARDAIVAADGASNAFANEESIWGGFADRGLGYGAVAPVTRMFSIGQGLSGHLGIGESFLLPFLDKGTVTIDDNSCGNGNGSIDPGEIIDLTIGLKNPWHKASKGVPSATATLSTSTAGVTIVNGNSTYGAIAAQATVNGTPFKVAIPASATAGQALDFVLNTTSALGASAVNIKLRVGTPSGTGAPITYTQTIPSPFLAIPDNNPRGVFTSMAITDDFEIADLDFRVDNITHTFVGDLSVMLKGPTGYGADFVSVIGGAIDGGPGDNLINMLIDDEAPPTQDMVQAPASQAPFTASWLPVFNAPVWPLVGFGPQDPIGNLSRFDGGSTMGTWSVHCADVFSIDTGTLRAWSIIVTPRAFTATPFTAPPPSVVCPANISLIAPPNQMCVTVTYTTPTATGCGAATVSCVPPSGTCVPLGTTTITCTATDSLTAQQATCSFSVKAANIRLQDDSTPSRVFIGNSLTGDYSFCCGGTPFTGQAVVSKVGNVVKFTHNAPDRRLTVTFDGSTFKGTATLQSPPGTTRCTITDRDTRNDTGVCP